MHFTLDGADRTRQEFEANGQPIHSAGREQGVVVIRDVTDRTRAEVS